MERKNCVIFYTDDDEDDRDLFKEAFKSVTDKCTIAMQSDGNELLQLLEKTSTRPSILFLDLNMLEINGYDVLKEIRRKEGMRTLPVVIFSTSDDIQAIDASRQLGASLYIPKPTSFLGLKEVINHTLSIDWVNFTPSYDNFVYRANQLLR